MQIIETPLSGLLLIKPKVFRDDRGYFVETWQRQRYKDSGLEGDFVQDNHSQSSRGVLRGLHYQIKQPQGKLVRVSVGAVFDVAVDLRRSSTTFGQWWGAELNEDDQHQMWVPPGFAHGFYVLSSRAEFQYKCTNYYAQEYERSLCWNDPAIGIEWPLVGGEPPILAAKDAAAPLLSAVECFA